MSRTVAPIALLLALVPVGCEKVALLAPNQSTITLSVNTTTLPLNGSAEVAATVIEQAGTPVHNGTEVTFTSSVGTMDPPTARTQGGIARSTFRANTQSGTAQISAFSGGARVQTPIEVRVGSAAVETVRLRTDPASVPQTGGQVQVIATAVDAAGNAQPSVQVIFSSDAGTLGATSATTDQNGEARTTLQTNRQTIVRAQVAGKEAQATVAVVALPTVTLTASSTTPLAGTTVTFTITPGATTTGSAIQNVTFNPGDGSPTQNLGAISNAQTISHRYDSAGTYTASAEVRDVTGQTNRAQVVVVVQRAQITVTITATPTDVVVGQNVTFTVTATTQAGGPPIRNVVVNFSDGQSFTTQPGQAFTRSFSTTGTIIATATATDTAGSTGQGSTTVVVRQRPAIEMTLDAAAADSNFLVCNPPASYPKTCTVTLGFLATSVRVAFTAGFVGSAPNNVQAYTWDFDDGTIETTSNRNNDHVFTARRTYVITVRATTTDGGSGSQRLTLIVQ